jgi:hypothetical protein
MKAATIRTDRWKYIAIAILIAAAMMMIYFSNADASPVCKKVKGRLVDETAIGGGTSVGTFLGTINGDYQVSLLSGGAVPGAPSGVEWATGTSQVTTSSGVLNFFEAANIDTSEQDYLNAAVLMTVTGGTGSYAGATGHLALSGYFHSSTGTGDWDYQGVICVP